MSKRQMVLSPLVQVKSPRDPDSLSLTCICSMQRCMCVCVSVLVCPLTQCLCGVHSLRVSAVSTHSVSLRCPVESPSCCSSLNSTSCFFFFLIHVLSVNVHVNSRPVVIFCPFCPFRPLCPATFWTGCGLIFFDFASGIPDHQKFYPK